MASDWAYDNPDPNLRSYETPLIWFALLRDQLRCPFEEMDDSNDVQTLLEYMGSNLPIPGGGNRLPTMHELREAYQYWQGTLSEWGNWVDLLRERILEAEKPDARLGKPLTEIIREYMSSDIIKQMPIAVKRESMSPCSVTSRPR